MLGAAGLTHSLRTVDKPGKKTANVKSHERLNARVKSAQKVVEQTVENTGGHRVASTPVETM